MLFHALPKGISFSIPALPGPPQLQQAPQGPTVGGGDSRRSWRVSSRRIQVSSCSASYGADHLPTDSVAGLLEGCSIWARRWQAAAIIEFIFFSIFAIFSNSCIFANPPPPPPISPQLFLSSAVLSASFTLHTRTPFRAVQTFLPTGPYQRRESCVQRGVRATLRRCCCCVQLEGF